MKRTRRWLLCALLALCAVVSVAPLASAQDRNAQQIEQFRAMLAEQVEQDTGGLAKAARELIERWLDEAESLIKQGERTEATRRLKRVEDGMDWVRALVAASQVAGAADRQEEAAKTAADQVEALKKEIETLDAKRAEIQAQLRQLQ
jgi:hypothetical protein